MHRSTAVVLGLLVVAPALAFPGFFAPATDPCAVGNDAACAPAMAVAPRQDPPELGPRTEVRFAPFPTPRPLGPAPSSPSPGVPETPTTLAGAMATVPAPPVEVHLARPPPSTRSFPVPPPLPELPVCDGPLPLDQVPPGLVFLVETRLPGEEPRITPALPYVWNPVDADGVLLSRTGILGVDLLVQVLPDLTFGEFTVRIVRATPQALDDLAPALLGDVDLNGTLEDLPGGSLLRPIPAMDVRLVLPLTGGPEPGLVPQGCERAFLAAGYGYDTGAQPEVFEAVVDLERLDDHDLYVETRLHLEDADPRLDLLLDHYDARTYHAARSRTLEVRATLHGLPSTFDSLLVVDTSAVDLVEVGPDGLLPPLPPPLDALLGLDAQVAKGTATALDWRAGTALERLTARVHKHNAASATDVTVDLSPLPAKLSEVLTTAAATTVTHDADVPLDLALTLDQFVRDGQGAATLVSRALVEVDDLPRQVLFHIEAGATHVDYAGSEPLGRVEVLQGNHAGPFPSAPGDHFLLDTLEDTRRSVSLRATGVLEAHWRNGPMKALDLVLDGGKPFQVYLFTPDVGAFAGISAMPSELELRSDFATVLRYRADKPIPSLDVYAATADLTATLRFDRLPRVIDAALGGNSVEITFDEPLGKLVADLQFKDPIAGLPYDRVHAEAVGVPGVAAAWNADGTHVGVQALPPGAALGSVLVQLTNDTEFLAPAGEGAFLGLLNTTAQRATLRMQGLERTTVNLEGGVDLLYEAAAGVPLVVAALDTATRLDVTLEDLPDRVRFLSDLQRLFSYEGSAEVATLTVDLYEFAAENRTTVEVHGIPSSLLLLLDTEAGALDFDTGGEAIASATAYLERPDGLNTTGLRSGRIHLEQVPGVHARWGEGQASFRTSTGALGLLHADLSSELPLAEWKDNQDVDRVVFWQEFPPLEQQLNGPAKPTFLHIHAHVEGLREATARSSDERVVGDIRLVAPRPFDVVYHNSTGPCLTSYADLQVRDLPSFHVDTDLAGTIVYEASDPIENVSLYLAQQQRGLQPLTCKPKDESWINVTGVPTRMETVLSLEPISAWFDASGPIGNVSLDLRRPGNATQRTLVNVSGIPANLAATLDEARANLLFQASAPVEEVRVLASSELEPVLVLHQAAYDEASAALVVRNLTTPQGQELTTALKLRGLESAALSLQQGALEAEVRLAPGPAYLDLLQNSTAVTPSLANHTLVLVESSSRAYHLTALADERLRVETDRGLQSVLVRHCDQGHTDLCHGNETLVFLVGLPPLVDVRLTGLGAEFDLDGGALQSLHLNRVGTDAPFDPEAVRSLTRATVWPVTSGHARFLDPGSIDVQFERPARIDLDQRSNALHDVPFEDVHTSPKWTLDGYSVGVWTEAPSSLEGLGRDPYTAVRARLGLGDEEGVRKVQVHLDRDPMTLEVDWELREFTFLKFSSPLEPLVGAKTAKVIPAWPDLHLGLTEPPDTFALTIGKKELVYPPEAYHAHPWSWDLWWPERILAKTEGGFNSKHTTVSFSTLDSPATGDLVFSFSLPLERNQAYYDGEVVQPETFFVLETAVPPQLDFHLYQDPNVKDSYYGSDDQGEHGDYLGVDLELPARQSVNAYASFPGDWFLETGGDRQVGRLFFDLFRPFDAFNDGHKPKNRMWMHLLADADLNLYAKRDLKYAWDPAEARPVKTEDPAHYRFKGFLKDTDGTLWVSTDISPQSCKHMTGEVEVILYYDGGGFKWDLDTAWWAGGTTSCLAAIANVDPKEVWL